MKNILERSRMKKNVQNITTEVVNIVVYFFLVLET